MRRERWRPILFNRFACASLLALPVAILVGEGSEAWAGESAEPRAGLAASQEVCAQIAASAEAIRIDRRRLELASLEKEIGARLSMLESKQQELRFVLDRLDSFERKTSEALIGLYARMKPEAAAAQLSQLDADVAAGIMLQLKAKVSSAILGEMDAPHGAALAKKISQLRRTTDGKQP